MRPILHSLHWVTSLYKQQILVGKKDMIPLSYLFCFAETLVLWEAVGQRCNIHAVADLAKGRLPVGRCFDTKTHPVLCW
ncbi:hypothetical protein BHE74_00035947 [Ensete ventricosum]|nr:hypothetical protein BHE74_00035947 [Ensete ventricosum]